MIKIVAFTFLYWVVATSAYSLPSTTITSSSPANKNTEIEVTRRGWISSAGLAAASAFALGGGGDQFVANAAEGGLTKFEDSECKISLSIPSDWTKSEQVFPYPDRRKITFFIKPNSDNKSLVFLAYTPVRDDFTSLGSFGNVDQVAQMTILPKGDVAGEDAQSVMYSAESKKSAYFFDYKQKVPNLPETHFRTIFYLAKGATGGAGSVLVTITAQTPESEYASMKPLFDEIIESFA